DGLRWTPPEQWHLTLAFLAAVPERRTEDLLRRLERAAARRPPLELAMAGGGCFPRPSAARVLWAGLEPGEAVTGLGRLATGVRAAAERAGAEPDHGRFRAHLTLARRNVPADLTRWVEALAGYRGPSWRAGAVELVRSELGRGESGRPRHVVVRSFPLTG
ncbi:RNA 2',3'-cyclic phosphodiesterase, partial [Desertihabitans aurantiacus]|uniref:RNA 2',3'-cyclic phosphodiesterase n=1 Tax=Desertihabitans aurantiacus TaxID=2282477 RepID=UPI000DF7F027